MKGRHRKCYTYSLKTNAIILPHLPQRGESSILPFEKRGPLCDYSVREQSNEISNFRYLRRTLGRTTPGHYN